MENYTIDDFDFGIDDLQSHLEYNTTIPQSVELQLRLYDIFIPLFGVFIIILNLIVVISSGLILKQGQQPKTTYLFLGNVALADLFTGLAVVFGAVVPKTYVSELSCNIVLGLIVSSTITSVYSVGLIAVDRYLYILYGLHYQRFIYPKRSRIMIVCSWLIGGVVGFLPAMGWSGDTQGGQLCWFIRQPKGVVLLTTIVGIVPLIVILVLYSIILYRALVRVVQLQRASKSNEGVQSGDLRLFRGGNTSVMASTASGLDTINTEPSQTKKSWFNICSRKSEKTRAETVPSKAPSKWKAIKIVLFTTGSFVITWTPYFIAATWYVYCDKEQTPTTCNNLKVAVASPLAILGFLNSLLNPIIYAWWHKGFRMSIRRIWHRNCFRSKKNAVGPLNSSQKTASTSGSTPIGSETEGSDVESRPMSVTMKDITVTNRDSATLTEPTSLVRFKSVPKTNSGVSNDQIE